MESCWKLYRRISWRSACAIRKSGSAAGARGRCAPRGFDRPETLESAFRGIDRLLIISADGDNETRIRQHGNAVAAAERAGVRFIAYTSIANARESKTSLRRLTKQLKKRFCKRGFHTPSCAITGTWK
ncbi:hypothetical protein PO124_11985 [Bacillus licheniformis]|nr:hypothetical protein [Bacillus licheniformis]